MDNDAATNRDQTMGDPRSGRTLRSRIRSMLRTVSGFVPFSSRAGIIARILPPSLWYFAALRMSRLHRNTALLLGHRTERHTEAFLRDCWLIEFARRGGFPIPWNVTGLEVFLRPGNRDAGTLVCGLHLPLSRVALGALVEAGHAPTHILADRGNVLPGDQFLVPGQPHTVPALVAGPQVLVQIRSVLRAGGSIGCLLDTDYSEPISPNILRLAGKVGARIIFFTAELDRQDRPQIHFYDPPHPFCESMEAVQANLAALAKVRARVLASL